MIKFFRKIRQNLLTENKFSRYILYALGEILLVMMGILLALQVNNWNNGKKDRAIESYLLYSLREDLNNDLIELSNNIIDAENLVISSNGILDFHSEIPMSNNQLQKYVNDLNGVSFDMNNLTYNEMLSAGTFKLLSDILRREIAKYYWMVNSYDGMRDENLQLKRTTAQLFQKNGCVPGSINAKDLKTALNDRQLLAVIKQWGIFGPYQVLSHRRFQSIADGLLDKIESEIALNNY